MSPPPPPRRGYQDVSPSSGREGSQQRGYYGGNNAYQETNNGNGSWLNHHRDVSDAGRGPASEGQRDDRYGYYERRRGHEGRERRGGEEDRNSSYYGNNEFSGHRSSREYDTQRENDNTFYGSQADDNRYASSHLDWKCLECRTWNYPDEGRCHRCGTHVDDMFPPHHHPDNRNLSSYHGNEHQGETSRRDREDDKNSQDKGRESDALDEFGRAKKKTKTSSKKEWPPCFDTHGAEYVLDTRSGGMFYHSESNFFYDPQTKLYYGNRDATYYRYDPDHDKNVNNDDNAGKKKPSSPFVAVQKVKAGSAAAAGSSSSHHDAHTPDPVLCGNSSAAKTGGKPSISITLKTKKLPKKGSSIKSKTEATAPAVPTVQRRQHDADISKWSERQEEMKQQQETPKEEKQASDSKTIARTAKGEPICTLCQRKFPSVEKLRYHERVSKLHAENLAKQQQQTKDHEGEGAGVAAKTAKEDGNPESQQKNSTSETSSYVDRARQRRQMYGQDATTEASAIASMTTAPSPPPTDTATPDVVRPDQTLGSHNVGNQMLQKLGWKSGQSLGRRSEGGDDNNNDDGNNGNNTNKALQKDWERIEALAAQRK